MARLEDQFAELDTMVKGDLKDRWEKLTGRPLPQVSTKLLRLALAYEIRAKALGGSVAHDEAAARAGCGGEDHDE